MNKKLLDSLYYNRSSQAGYSSVDKLYKEAKKKQPALTKSIVKEYLKGELTYTLHKPSRRRFKRNSVVVSHVDEQWQADLCVMDEWSSENKGYKYILTVIDVFSKFAFAKPLKTKTGKEVAHALEQIFKYRKPTFLQTDQGTEFKSKDVQNILKENEIKFFTSQNQEIKCSIVERFNKSLKNRIFKIATKRGNRKWIDILQDCLVAYNNSMHSKTLMRPAYVKPEHENIVFKRLYGFKDYRDYLRNKATEKPRVPIGAMVRTQHKLDTFSRGYFPYWQDQVHTIKAITPGKRPLYKLEGKKQRFYPEQIQQINNDPLFRISKIHKRRTILGKKQIYAELVGYNGKYWLDGDTLQKI